MPWQHINHSQTLVLKTGKQILLPTVMQNLKFESETNSTALILPFLNLPGLLLVSAQSAARFMNIRTLCWIIIKYELVRCGSKSSWLI
jgi:hypothetical protein